MWWPSVFFGGLAGSLLTLGGQAACRYWKRPILEIKQNEKGCRVETPAWVVDNKGDVVTGPDGKPLKVEQVYLRLKIKNRGRTFARNASVCVTDITYERDGTGQRLFSEEVLDPKLSLIGHRALLNLASGAHRFVDLVHTEERAGHPVALKFDFIAWPFRMEALGFSHGHYEFTVFVVAENAQSNSSKVKWSWDGTLKGLKIEAA